MEKTHTHIQTLSDPSLVWHCYVFSNSQNVYSPPPAPLNCCLLFYASSYVWWSYCTGLSYSSTLTSCTCRHNTRVTHITSRSLSVNLFRKQCDWFIGARCVCHVFLCLRLCIIYSALCSLLTYNQGRVSETDAVVLKNIKQSEHSCYCWAPIRSPGLWLVCFSC